MRYYTNTAVYFLLLFFTLHAQPVKENGQLKVSGTQLCNQEGNPIVLRGVSYGWHNWWPKYYNAENLNWLVKDWKINVIRAAMGIEPDNGYINKPEWSTGLVKNVVNAAIDQGIYVIIDWHSHNINLDEALEFFKEMAVEYGDKPNIIYEIFNEPDDESWEDIKVYSIAIIKAIRAVDPDNIILVGSPDWDQDVHLVADDPITGFENIMYTLHFYAATHKEWLRERGDYALKKGVPIFVSESAGMNAYGTGEIDYKEWDKWINWMEENKISWIIWSIADKNESCSMLLPGASNVGAWPINDLNESGIKTRELIRKYNLHE